MTNPITYNRKSVIVGNPIELTLEVRNTFDDLADADQLPTYNIYTPELSLYSTGSGIKTATGVYVSFVPITKDALVSPDWKITWTYIFNGNEKTFEEYFIVNPFTSTLTSLQVSIDDNSLSRIKSVIGYPFISEEIALSDEQIKDICIRPSFEIYFSKFPIQTKEQKPISGELILPFPTDNTYGVTDCRVINKISGENTQTSNNFFQLLLYGQIGGAGNRQGYGKQSYGTRYNFGGGMQDNWWMRRETMDSIQNNLNTFKYYPDTDNRQLLIFSSLNAIVEVEWASYSLNIAQIQLQRRHMFIKMAQWHLLDYYANLAGLFTNNENNTNVINVEVVRARATELYTEITEWMNAFPDVISIPMS